MKSLIIATSILALTAWAYAKPVSESRQWIENYKVSTTTPHLSISNIWGNVRVRPGPSGEISVSIDERRWAPDQKRYDRSLETLKLNVDTDNNGVSLRVGNPSECRGNYEACDGCRVDYQFDVLVPMGTQLDLRTVNDGIIDVTGIVGSVRASNVNGPITVEDLRNCEVLESVNGKVDLSFKSAPDRDCKIKTINGNVTINMPEGAGLDLATDLFNGHMVSDFQAEAIALPAVVDHRRSNGRNHYKIQQPSGIRLEGGGPTFSISSMNGDIRIQKTRYKGDSND